MNKCQYCSKDLKEHRMISLTFNAGEQPISICNNCFNEYMADKLVINDYDEFAKEVTFFDCDKNKHVFQIKKRVMPAGILWEAIEFLEEEKIGYTFKVHQEFEDNPIKALEELHKRIEKGLSRKFIKKEFSFGKEFSILKDDIAKGRIEWDENFDGSMPKLIIDGEEYSLVELGKILMTYEGWDFKLEISDPTD